MNKKYIPLLAMVAGTLLPLHGEAPEGYTLMWADEFDYTGAPNPEYWSYDLGGGGWGNNEVQFYTDSLDNSRVEDGKLIIEARQILGGRSPQYESARLLTRDKVEFKYGRIEARMKLPSETGTWPAFWMLAAEQKYGNAYWPDNGEIDILESVGYEEDPLFIANLPGSGGNLPNIHGTVHTFLRNGRDNSGIGSKTYVGTAATGFNDYAITWTEEYIEWEVNGTPYFKLVKEDILPSRTPPEFPWQHWPFDEEFFLILNIAVGGNWGGLFNSTNYPGVSPYPNGIDHDGVWPQRMEVDYIRVYARSWNGYTVESDGYVDTGSWMGPVNVTHDPWIYSYTLENYFYYEDQQWIWFHR